MGGSWRSRGGPTPARPSARRGPFPRSWYLGQPGCTPAEKTAAEAGFQVPVSCDELPNWAMDAAGPGLSLEFMPATVKADRIPFLVVGVPVRRATVWACGN